MQCVLTAPLAILLELDTIRIVLLVLRGRVVSAFAFCARQCDQCTHEFSFKNYSASSRLTHERAKMGLALLEARAP